MNLSQRIGLAAGPLLAVSMYVLCEALGIPGAAAFTASITTLCAVWWVTEAIPIPVTSLIPFMAFPAFGVVSHAAVGSALGHTVIVLLLGGFMLSTAMEKSGAHRRLAVFMVRLVGGKGPRLVLGFMLASAMLSMWISNSATTLMLLPVALAILAQDRSGTLASPLLLGTAYAASIGGLGTPIGTPPNAIFIAIYKESTGVEIGFLEWMKIGVPTVLVLLPLAWWTLTRGLRTDAELELPAVGTFRTGERRVLWVFAATALAWMTRVAPFGGWSEALGLGMVGDSTVALIAVLALFLIPDGEDGRLLDWQTASGIPWGLLILFAGGIAIAKAFDDSGLSAALGASLTGLSSLPVVLMIAALCLCVTFLTELTSNTATATLLMPILYAAATAARIEPTLLMVPAALSASCAFMMPVATGPNAIVFGTDRIRLPDMARQGLVLNLFGVVVITALSALLLGP